MQCDEEGEWSTVVTERGLEVLGVIVTDYIASRGPVGSKSIVERHPFNVSAATIRNEMALLEEEGLIAAPHTSSGRIPTDSGYRLFVDRLTEVQPLTKAQRVAIEQFLGNASDLDTLLSRSVRLLSQLTGQVALAQYPSLSQASVRQIELVALGGTRVLVVLITDTGRVEQRVSVIEREPTEEELLAMKDAVQRACIGRRVTDVPAALEEEARRIRADTAQLMGPIAAELSDAALSQQSDKLVMAGTANLARVEEDFPGTILPVLEAIEEQVVLLKIFAQLQRMPGAVDVSASIGSENAEYGLQDASIVSSGYTTGSALSRLGVLGPTRMDYPTNMAAVRAVAGYLTTLLGER